MWYTDRKRPDRHTHQSFYSGTGVNLNQERFISDAPNPVSLFQITGQRYDRKEILHQLMERVAHYYTLLKNGETELIASRYQDVRLP